MILGNKCDVEDKRAVSKEKGEMVLLKCIFIYYHGNHIFIVTDCQGTWNKIHGNIS
jgi:hypothetical protein